MKAEHVAAHLNTEHSRPRSTDTRSTELTRTHALNWTGAVIALGLCVVMAVWVGLRALNVSVPPRLLVFFLPLPLLVGICVGSVKLIQFTEEHRNWLYAAENAIGVDLDGDGEIGDPRAQTEPTPGTMLMGIDGARHRIDVELSAGEIQAVKRLLIESGKATVRGLTGPVGERASALRDALIGLGICEAPTSTKSAANLSEPGKKAVMRW